MDKVGSVMLFLVDRLGVKFLVQIQLKSDTAFLNNIQIKV